MTRILALLLLLFVPMIARGEQVPVPAVATWFPGLSIADGDDLLQRVESGGNIQVLLLLPSAVRTDGALLNPLSVSLKWEDVELPSYVYFKRPDVAMVFGLSDPAMFETAPEGRLRLAMRIARGRTTYIFESELYDTRTHEAESEPEEPPMGRMALFRDEDGTPLEGASLFGQRRSDLYAVSGPGGTVRLDAPLRSTPGHHYAWSPDHWTTAFEPLTSPTVTLLRRRDSDPHLVLSAENPNGEEIIPFVVYIDNNHYRVKETVAPLTVRLRPEGETEMIILAAGYRPKRLLLQPGQKEYRAVLDSHEGAAAEESP